MAVESGEGDARLVLRTLMGDSDAFGEIVKRYERQVFDAVRGIVPDAFTSEDNGRRIV